MTHAVLALGSNVGDSFETLQGAVDVLFDAPGLDFVAVSPVYETAPVGGPDGQRPYLNAVVVAETVLAAMTLLERAQGAEAAFARVRGERWGPRTLDVDIIVFDDVISHDEELTLPHPRAHERAFVLTPWYDVEPAAVLPGHGPIADLLARLDQSGVRQLDLLLQPPD
ncbi:2-amino-4-hydroxy-6-hydroxymethyldihydropteridine diphosphokinase [Rhizohabitans arisaemae]|uniref:2-amino-4-hydroxy-6- hydroxymethyldihydropteridine diphosphokinase n=1 Tax=Rhizohabitans arisaemae TaxID=2720610 RepID=UPI0024B0D3B8|nr:2-amino-4-hydroxy-6-hydroxymethyldihydropteridine diphosphokinase [Rhizohabitans arisaemae]